MHLLNYLSLQTAQTTFIATDRIRTAQDLVGVRNGVNLTFTIPASEHYVHNLPYLSIAVFLNGQRMSLIDDYIVVESLGSGTGYDAIVLNEAPFNDDHILADYVVLG